MNYKRNYTQGGTYFFTVNLHNRRSSLLIDHIDLLRNAISTCRAHYPFTIDAWVVLPDHIHTIWTLPATDSDYSSRWRYIKQTFSRSLREELGTPQLKVWQHRFWEHLIRSDDDYRIHFDYTHRNPLKHQLVTKLADWPYSTFFQAVKAGIYSADWCGEDKNDDLMTGE